VLIFVHGGGWTHKQGDPYTRGRLGPHNAFFASHGVIVASISYRLSPEHQHPAHVEDVARAIAWIKANVDRYGGDPDQIFLTGHSAGGHLVALVVTDPKYLQAYHLSASHDIKGVIPISGPFAVGKNGDRIDTIWGSQAAADDASPINHLRAGLPPFLIFAGDQGAMEEDRTEQAKSFVDLLHQKGVEAAFVQARDRDHSTIVTKLGTPGDPVAERMLQFIREHRR
jgi:acetyl esterase/lipase